MVTTTLTQQLARSVSVALKENVAIPESKAWVRDVIVESVVVTCLEEGVPCDVEAAMTSYQGLFLDHLDDVEDADIRDFCSAALKRLGELLDAGSGSEEGEGEEQDRHGLCAMCERPMPLTKHHLIPRDVHSQYRKKGHSVEQLNQGIMICRPCHSAIHRTFDNKTLASDYASLAALLQCEDLTRFVAWARKQRVTNADISQHQRRYRR